MNDVECLWRKKGMSAHQFDDHIRVCSGVIEMGCHGCARALWPTIERVRCGEWWSNMFLKLEIDAQKKSLQLSLPVGKSKLATTRLLFYWHVFCVCVRHPLSHTWFSACHSSISRRDGVFIWEPMSSQILSYSSKWQAVTNKAPCIWLRCHMADPCDVAAFFVE